ncbi:MAG: hypothetical protein IJD75_02445, partial [Clostridia bacterium]|nr:hypothetical protein [Clostridia bacterium]
FSFRVAINLSILLYHIRRFFGITFVAHPHSGWLSVSRGALNCLKALIQNAERTAVCSAFLFVITLFWLTAVF